MSAERFAIRQEDIAKLNRIAEILELEDHSDELQGECNEWADVQRIQLIAQVMDAGWWRSKPPP